jgi:uncharacterized membrane protein
MLITEQMGLVIAIVSTFIVLIIEIIIFYDQGKRQRRTEEKTSERIDRLSKVLKDASLEMDKLEREVNTKSKKLEELNPLESGSSR